MYFFYLLTTEYLVELQFHDTLMVRGPYLTIYTKTQQKPEWYNTFHALVSANL